MVEYKPVSIDALFYVQPVIDIPPPKYLSKKCQVIPYFILNVMAHWLIDLNF